MIGISAPTFDTVGALYLYADQLEQATLAAQFDRQRRTTKYRTLDGGVAVTDQGHAHGDRDLTVAIARATPAQAAAIARLVERYSTLVLSTRHGCYLVSPASCTGDGSTIKLNLSFISEV